MKERFSASVDVDLLASGRQAVEEGRAPSLSAWVNTALEKQVETDVLLRAGGDWLAAYEAEYGVITQEEMDEAARWSDEMAIKVRGGKIVE